MRDDTVPWRRVSMVLAALALASAAGANTPVGACGAPATAIAEVQGAGARSPRDGERVRVEAVVTAVYPGLKGFYLMTPDDEQDDDPATSEGLFVYDPDARVTAGQRLRVAGTVGEFHGLTRIRAAARRACGPGASVTPVALTLPFADQTRREALEGMLVSVAQPLTVSGNHELARYGSVTLSRGRLFIPTQRAAPGEAARALRRINQRNRVVLDDGATVRDPRPVRYPPGGLTAHRTLRVGDRTRAFRAVFSYGFGEWRLQPLGEVRFEAANPRPPAPARIEGTDLRVAAFNVLNYFNGDGDGGGFPTPRGARDGQALARQRAKLVAAIRALEADVVGLMEIENDGYGAESAIAGLSDALGPDWRYVHPGGARLGGDAIAVGLIYRADRVAEAGSAATTDRGAFAARHRPPLAQTFRRLDGERSVTVVVNHFKSKGGCPARGPDRDRGDGQGCWNAARVAAAHRLSDWLSGDPTGAGHARTLVVGDLNSYAREQPLGVLRKAGLVDLIGCFQGEQAYSYVYRGEAGYLDHALASPALVERVLAARHWPINADEPPGLDYRQRRFYAADPYRSSDHDPVLVDLALEGDAVTGSCPGAR